MFLSLDREKKLELKKTWENFPLDKWRDSKKRRFLKRNIIVSVDPSSAFTVSFPVEAAREPENEARPITAGELENLLSQLIDRAFGRERSEAAKKLGLDELDTVLVNAEAGDYKIDGYNVLNPLSFPGKTVGAVLRLTFSARPVFEYLKNLFGSASGFFFTSEAQAGLFLLSKLGEPPLNLVIAGSSGTSCFSLAKAAWGNLVYEEKFGWLPESLTGSLASAFAVSPMAAAKIYGSVISGRVSENFKRAAMKIMKPELDSLFRGLKISKLKGPIYLHSPLAMPLEMPFRCGRAVVSEIPAREAISRLGFSLNFAEWPMVHGDVFMRLAPFFEFYYGKNDSGANDRLRRRIHWLS